MKVVSKFAVFSILLLSVIVLYAVSSFDLAHAQQPTKQTSQPPKQQPTKPDPAEEAGQVLRVGTKLVNVLFSVTDKQNRYLDNTQQENGENSEFGYYFHTTPTRAQNVRLQTILILLHIRG